MYEYFANLSGVSGGFMSDMRSIVLFISGVAEHEIETKHATNIYTHELVFFFPAEPVLSAALKATHDCHHGDESVLHQKKQWFIDDSW